MKDEKMSVTYQDRTAVCCSGQGAGTGLKELVIVPWGTVKSKKGTFVMDSEGARQIVLAFDVHGVGMMIDWEHESLEAKGRTDAAGWVEKLWSAPGVGLKALVKWTDKAREAIRSDTYRYLSPVLTIRKEDRHVVGLHGVGLTNMPAIPGVSRVAANTRVTQETELTMTGGQNEAMAQVGKLRTLLGLDEGTSVTDVLKAAAAKIEAMANEDDGDGDTEVASSVRELLNLSSDAPKAAIVLALKMRDASGASEELVEMRAAEADRVAHELVDKYVQAFKINANDETTMSAAAELARTQPDLLDRIMSNAASVMPPQGQTTPPPGPGSRGFLIDHAVRDYHNDADMQSVCGCVAAVNMSLREAGMGLLSDAEALEYIVEA